MPIFVDCPGCAVLIRGDERSCPFCGVTQQKTTGIVGVLGLALGLMTASCGDKGGPSSDGTVSGSTSNSSTSDATDSNTTVDTGDFPTPTTAYAGPDTSVSVSETNEPSIGSAYAASESESLSDGTDTSSSSSSTGSTGDAGSTGDTEDTSGDTEDSSGGSSG